MNVRYPYGVLHPFSIKNIFYDKMNLKAFLFSCDDLINFYGWLLSKGNVVTSFSSSYVTLFSFFTNFNRKSSFNENNGNVTATLTTYRYICHSRLKPSFNKTYFPGVFSEIYAFRNLIGFLVFVCQSIMYRKYFGKTLIGNQASRSFRLALVLQTFSFNGNSNIRVFVAFATYLVSIRLSKGRT